MLFTEWMPTPDGWEHLTYHKLSEIVNFGVGIDVNALADHMKTHGYDEDEAIILYRGEILDGRHKHAACVIADIKPTFKRFVGKSAESYVAKKAFRQHLNASQRAMIAASIANGKHGGDRSKSSIDDLKTRDQVAETMNVGSASVDRAASVIEHGAAELQEAVVNGTVSVSDAANIVDQPESVQKKAVKKVKKKKAKTVTEAVANLREPGEETEPIKDEVGFVIPFKALQAFEDKSIIGKICKDLDAIIQRVEDVGKSDGGRMLHTTSQTQTLQQVRKSLWQGRPTHVCPYCKGNKKVCDPCKNSGWVNVTTYKNAPESLRKEMESPA